MTLRSGAPDAAALTARLGPTSMGADRADPPIRAELFGELRFEEHGRLLADAHRVEPRAGKTVAAFFPRLRDNLAVLERSRMLLERRMREGLHVGPAGQWLLDNAALIDEQLHAVQDGLPRNFYRRLPTLAGPPLKGLPRVVGLAWAYVAHADSQVSEALLESCLRGYQSGHAPLTLGELWALPITLRVMLLENLRRLAERLAATQEARDAAHRWFDGPTERRTLAELDRVVRSLRDPDLLDTFLLQLEQRQDDLPYDNCRELAHWLAQHGQLAPDAEVAQQARAAEDAQSVRNAIVSLRRIDQLDWLGLFERIDPVMRRLARLPVHAGESADSRGRTLAAVARLARRSDRSEAEVTQSIAERCEAAPAGDGASAPVHWWGGEGQGELRAALGIRPAPAWLTRTQRGRGRRAALYIAAVVGFTVLFAAGVLHRLAAPDLPGWMLAVTGLLLALPASEAVVSLLNRLISESVPPHRLPRLNWRGGIPASQRVMVVIPCMLTSARGIAELAAQLEQHHLANPESQAQFALLSDWADAGQPETAADLPLLEAARHALQALNARHGPAGTPQAPFTRFLLLHRGRRRSATQGCYIGWERKRGKLEALVRALAEPTAAGAGASNAPFLPLGELSTCAPDIRHLVTLDADTDLPPGRLRALVATAAHPANAPRLDDSGRRVTQGYGILQPRLATPLATGETDTWFHRLFAGAVGVDPYSAATSEVYQDLFGEGTYTGKGLLNVRAVHAVLGARLPEEQVLSHDLLEGSLVRCASVSDITLLEDAPLHADTAASRLHRWTRGDWQLLPFLRWGRREGLEPIHRWKMLDNLRRSLIAPAALAWLAWSLATQAVPAAWAVGVVLAAYGAGPLLGAVAALAPSRDDIAPAPFYRAALADLGRALATPLWHLALLLDQAVMYGDAVLRALYRHFVSRRQLLEWTTAETAQALARHDLRGVLRQHARTVAAAAALWLLALGAHGGALPASGMPALPWAWIAPLLAAWTLAPLWIWLASRPRLRPRRERLASAARDDMAAMARETWRFFELHVGPDDHHLPPDNVQFEPQRMVAHRTSPTNIGMYLLSVACAQELGFIGRAEMAERLQATLATLRRLPRHAGHLLNWIDTRSLQGLPPGYVSAVDSGNLCGHLLAVARACELAAQAAAGTGPLARRDEAALGLSTRRLASLQPLLQASPTLQALAAVARPEATRTLMAGDAAARHELAATLRAARHELDALRLGQDGDEPGSPFWLLHDHVATLQSLLHDRMEDPAEVVQTLQRCAREARTFALEPDFTPLYDPRRRLLHIGLRVDTGELDDNHYDLLASESRLTSLVAIAKGDVPPEHWGALGRPFYASGAQVGLKSWSGSMFEYLMPSLILDEPPASALGHALRSCVRQQQHDALARGTPWGVSESAMAQQDASLAYQYGPQGSPRLALRRTPQDEHVVAPYATALAAQVAPSAALHNLQALQALGARGPLGFIEALDYTPQRQVEGSHFTRVHTYMAHHQGMSLAAFTDLLADGAPRRWAMSDPLLRAVAALLHEPCPREVPPLAAPRPAAPAVRARAAHLALELQPLAEQLPTTLMLGHGTHGLWLRSHGAGVSLWRDVSVTRWRDDLLRDDHGSFVYLRRDGPGTAWRSLTAHPAADPAASYQVRLQPDRAVFEAHWTDLGTRTTVWLSPEDDGELRQVELHNQSDQTLRLELALAAEIALAPPAADEAHPAFSNLFVRAWWDESEHALYLQRRPRLADEEPLWTALFLAGDSAGLDEVVPCADRALWLGRHASRAAPSGQGGYRRLPVHDGDPPAPGVPLDTGLDPMAALRVRLDLAPGEARRVTFCCATSRDLAQLQGWIDKYRQASHVQRASNMSFTMAGVRLREMQLDAAHWRALLRLQTLLTGAAVREWPAQGRSAGGLQVERRALWRFGLSGERPILLVQVADESGVPLVQMLKKALRGWSAAGLGVDLVALNDEPHSYLMPVQRRLQWLRERQLSQIDERWPAAQRGALHILRAPELSTVERQTLLALARVRLMGDGRPLPPQVDAAVAAAVLPPSTQARLPVRQVARVDRSATQAPRGQFDPADGSFHFDLGAQVAPGRPWINVLANPDFGCLVSEAGAGMTWAGNSRQFQLTPWSNDALSDPPGEWLLLHDLAGGQVWPLGRAAGQGATQVTHGLGFTRLAQRLAGLDLSLVTTVDARSAVKQVQLRIANPGAATRHLRAVAMAEWVLGAQRADHACVSTSAHVLRPGPRGEGLPMPPPCTVLLATQLDPTQGFGQHTALLGWRLPSGAKDDGWTCDRREFFDPRGAMVLPPVLGRRAGLGLDPCAAVAAGFSLGPGQAIELTLLLGCAPDPAAALALADQAWRVAPPERLLQQRRVWDEVAAAVQVRTPDGDFDMLINRWLPYQTLACRLWARAGFYQAGGAFGFRDQLQDAMNMVNHAPALLAAQIRRHAARQFVEGDVQHWWHEPGGAGVRTHFSDDLLWLPLALATYVQRTGDHALLDERAPFLAGAAVPAGREDVYETPQVAAIDGTLYEHGARAIDRSLRTGSHGLPLIGTGDWNDGMNRVGHQGRGESVWLAWFLCEVVRVYLPLAEQRGDTARVQAWQAARRGWVSALEHAGWDGLWYRRAFFDDGTPLGSHGNAEGRIDLIAQAWAVLAGSGDPGRAREGMAQARELLHDARAGTWALLAPPLQHARPSAGYIQAYPRGVRENGGQYNHAAVWALMAWARLGDAAAAWETFESISPAHRWRHPSHGARYALEPFVLAGDILAHSTYDGRGGWSWYTGAAGWLMRAALESILGVTVDATQVHLRPCLPPHWAQAEVTLRIDGRPLRLRLCATAQALSMARGQESGVPVLRSGERLQRANLPEAIIVDATDTDRIAVPAGMVATA